MSIKVTFNSGFLNDILQRTKVSAADVTEAARTGVAAVSGKAGDTLACAKLRRAVTDLEDEIDLQLCDIGFVCRVFIFYHFGHSFTAFGLSISPDMLPGK